MANNDLVPESKQWVVSNDPDTQAEQIVAWVNANGGLAQYEPKWTGTDATTARIAVRSLNDWAYASLGDYVVKDYSWVTVNGRSIRVFQVVH